MSLRTLIRFIRWVGSLFGAQAGDLSNGDISAVFLVLLALALIAALVTLFISFQQSGEPTPIWQSDESALLDERNAVLRALRDLRYEQQVGKIDGDDYARLESAYRSRAKELMRALQEDDAPFRAEAERLLALAPAKAPAEEASDPQL